MIPPAPHHARRLLIAMAATLFILGGAGWLLMYFFHAEELYALLHISPGALFSSLIAGTVYAALTLPMLILLLRAGWMEPTRMFFARLMLEYRVQHWQIWALSACAGIGEELLFRGAIQPFLGIWPTALIFVLLHGYLNLFNRPLFVYGVLLTLVSAGFGYIAELRMLPAAMIAHAWIDVGLLYFLKRQSVNVL